jgi:lysyl endopeptidase
VMPHRLTLAVLAAACFAIPAHAASGLPPSAQSGLTPPALARGHIADAPDVSKFIAEDGKAIGGPFRYGVAVPVKGVSLRRGKARVGEIVRLADGRDAWRVAVASPGAKSIDFEFARLDLPADAEMYLYDRDYNVLRGPITRADVANEGNWFSAYVPGDVAVIEVVAAPAALRAARIELASLTHAYRGLWGVEDGAKSGSCNVDVICPAGDGWRDQIDSVGHYTFRQGASSFVCTGSLIANTGNTTTPYFLTANHCMSSATVVSSMVTYWNYQSSTCRTPGSTSSGTPLSRSIASHSQSGATLVATSAASDFTLVRLSTDVPAASNPFWSGWDRSGAAPSAAVGIHHPAGHEMRIANENNPLSISGYLGATGSGTTHLRVADWDAGTTEGGSSGSGLWDAGNKLLVGQLHGGYAACGNNDADWYGRLSVSWTGGGSAATRLRDWLDPGNTGVTTKAGYRGGSTPPPPPPGVFTNGTDFTINDNTTIESPITVSGRTGNAPANLQVSVTIFHTWRGDLKVDLVAPDGSVYVLHNRSGGSADNVIGTYTVNASSEVANGTWRLRVNDNAAGDTGRLDTWSLQF